MDWASNTGKKERGINKISIEIVTGSILVGGFNPFERYKSNWKSSPGRDEHKKYLKPPPSIYLSTPRDPGSPKFENGFMKPKCRPMLVGGD